MTGVAITSRYIWDSDCQFKYKDKYETQEKAQIQTKTEIQISNE